MSGTFTDERLPCRRAGDLADRLGPPAHPPRARRVPSPPVVITQLNDINARGAIVGNVFGLAAKDFGELRRIYPVLWNCPFGR